MECQGSRALPAESRRRSRPVEPEPVHTGGGSTFFELVLSGCVGKSFFIASGGQSAGRAAGNARNAKERKEEEKMEKVKVKKGWQLKDRQEAMIADLVERF